MISPIKVMILSLEFSPELSGGVGTHVMELATGLGQMGHQVAVLSCAPGKPTMIRHPNVAVYRISPSLDSLRAAKRSIVQGVLAFNDDLAAQAQSIIQESRPDILQYYGWLTFGAARKMQRIFGVPLIGNVQYLSEPIERWWGQIPDPEMAHQEKELYGQAGALISVSQWLKTMIQATHGVSEDQIQVVHNGLDVGRFIKQDLRREEIDKLRLAIAKPDQKIILFAGRLNPMKGISALFASAAKVVMEIPSARYVLVGEADSRDFTQIINQLFHQYPLLREKVKLLGKMPRQQLAIMYRIADIFLMPSLYEPFGWVAIEAMAAGLPIVSTDVGGPAEIVDHGRTGFLVPIRVRETGPHEVDVEQLAIAQIELLNDEALAKKLGDDGRKRIINNFSLDKMVQSTVDAYQRAISVFS